MLTMAGFVCGFVFGWGLLISGMVRPEKVLAFLDIFGDWDPSLAVVMAAALAVSGVGFAYARRRERPFFADQTAWPTRNDIDARLVIGATLFGIGWGLVGLCPGPALENLATLSPGVIVFIVAMTAGMMLHDFWQQRQFTRASRGRSMTAAADG